MNRSDFLDSESIWLQARIVGFNPKYDAAPFIDYGIVGALRKFGSLTIGKLYPREYLAWCREGVR